jgi:hypothetical protein
MQWVISGNWKVSGLGCQRRRCVRWTEEAGDLMVMKESDASPEIVLDRDGSGRVAELGVEGLAIG